MYQDYEVFEEQQEEAEPAPKDAWDTILTVLYDVVADEVKKHVENTRMAI